MKALNSIAVLGLVLFLGHAAIGTPTWITITDSNENPPEVTLVHNSIDSAVFKIVITGFYEENVWEEGTNYQKIWFKDETTLADSGYPQLPAIFRNIAVPVCDSVCMAVTTYGFSTLPDYMVYPAPNLEAGFSPKFCKNDSIYATEDYYPNQIEHCSGIEHFRDQNLVELTIMPISFSPDSQKIQGCDSLKVKLTFINASGLINEDLGIFTSAAQKMFLNYESLQTDEQPAQPGWRWCTPANIASYNCDYLIITAGFIYGNASCQNKIQELAAHRASFNGFAVCLVNVTDIASPPTWTAVRDFITDVYNCQNSAISSDGHLPFVLLVGDAWKDDPCTEEVDGYHPGETLSFKFWDASAGIEIPLEVTAVGQSYLAYEIFIKKALTRA